MERRWKCPKCGAEYPEEAVFCMKCGTKVVEAESVGSETIVPRLEELHARLQKTMPSSLAAQVQADTGDAEGENRILTVLFADVSGSVATTEKMTPGTTK